MTTRTTTDTQRTHFRLHPTLALALVAGLVATGCSSSSAEDDQSEAGSEKETAAGWFQENCPAELINLDRGDEEGASSDKAMTAGPLHVPAGAADTDQPLRYLEYDEMAESFQVIEEMGGDDTICFTQDLSSDDELVKPGDTPVDGSREDVVGFTKVRTPDYPDGVWIDWQFVSLDQAYRLDVDDSCAAEWYPAADLIDEEDAPLGEDQGNDVINPEMC